MSETPSGPVESCPQEQSPADALESQNAPSGGPRPLLPGELYQRQNQWWWRVQLPGEDRPAAHSLEADGEETQTDDQETAEKIALTLWERAIEENAARRIRLESTEKIERLKAQFLDKVRHFTELVETANAKLETEQRARAETEAKLAQMIQTVESMAQKAGPPGQNEGEPAGPSLMQVHVAARAEQAKPPMPALIPETPIPAVMQVPGSCEQTQVHLGQSQTTESVVVSAVAPPLLVETGVCECCGATGIAMTHLTRIDSGQWLCPRCLAALRTDATRSA